MPKPKLARTLKDVFNTADPAVPLQSGDPRYVDCTAVRGNEDVVSQMFNVIAWTEAKEPATAQLFTGHRGCGKSTELFRLKKRLEDAEYEVLYFEADRIIDVEDVVYSDVLVAIAQQVYDGLRGRDVTLGDDLLDDVFAWFAEVIFEQKNVEEMKSTLEAEFKAGTPAILTPLAQLMLKITGQLHTGVESRKDIRRKLDPQIANLIDRINRLLRKGTVELRKRGRQGLVIIVDNLDRIPFRKLDEQRNNHDALYIEHGEQLRALRAHLIYTVPIAILYSPRAPIMRGIFPDSLTLPMIKVHTAKNEPWPDGLGKMRQILGERIDLDRIFDEDALQQLCAESGGHPRILMTLVRYACQYAADRYPRPIDSNAIQRAITRLVSDYSRSIPEEHFPLLANVFHAKQVKNDDNHRLMLHNLSLLEYMNGVEPWHDVHPSVRRLAKFREACPDA